ncbi:hypothetical protein KLEB273_gp233 [Bacillus phage vB_BauM_KLEB27-3]|nr:hypothetical protein KLEB273_gp233 [Bacillus phage vB_BauM_KLEB27-3]
MGMFDTFFGIVQCPKCHQLTEAQQQFKWGESLLLQYYIGQMIFDDQYYLDEIDLEKPYSHPETFIDHKTYNNTDCLHCSHSFQTAIIIYNGQYIMMDVLEKAQEFFEEKELHYVHPLQGKFDFQKYNQLKNNNRED